ncbi:MAG: division plane positioning ATPase MipZ [Sulfurovum sp.]|nr:division plane positioning ATPase MipZ [Sulfurovum sp.]
METMVILNTKGGAGKSTVALQVAAAYFIQKGENVDLFEFDDENKDSLSFSNSQIRTKQIKIGDGKDISDVLRENLLNNKLENIVVDVGGNKTTTTFIDGLKKSSIYKKVNLILIPMSGGEQDTKNAIKTYNLVKDFNIPVVFVLSRVSNISRIAWKYTDFFMHFPNSDYIILRESDVIELSRHDKRSIYEIATDKELLNLLDQELDSAFDRNDMDAARRLSIQKEISLEAVEYLEDTLEPAWKKIDEACKG